MIGTRRYLNGLILLLALVLAGCGASEVPETVTEPASEAVTEAVTETTEAATVPTVPTEPAPPLTLEYSQGEESLVLELFDGGGYGIYIPPEGWTRESEVTGGRLTDRWSDGRGITLEVISCGPMAPESVEKQLLATKFAYHFGEEENGFYRGIDNVRGRCMLFSVRSDGSGSFALAAEYPGGLGEKRLDLLQTMMDSFFIWPGERIPEEP